jgi:dTDP-4-dehydrorhamnose 3,5-epimerase
MQLITTKIPEVMLLEPKVFGDERGFFLETWRASLFTEAGIADNFVQDNHSRSAKGVLRGLHYQLHQPQGKLVRVLNGEIFDVAVDMRRSSATFGQWVGEYLNDQNKRALWVPPGFAHGFLVLSESADVCYKCTDYYAPQHECSLLWKDPSVGISWPQIDELSIQLSLKDQRGLLLQEAPTYG